ncbi:hypothetical protein CVT24_012816 [Panaeolus cyanescens]|uniref:Uncharacterized protein n=1 Tax=Panaeolus cyanescens TaxID=181874 RepID=A0A409YJV2_9AGAR|nr:hypothetical protein CVT24_012816 [Panaeolus cyanescens]
MPSASAPRTRQSARISQKNTTTTNIPSHIPVAAVPEEEEESESEGELVRGALDKGKEREVEEMENEMEEDSKDDEESDGEERGQSALNIHSELESDDSEELPYNIRQTPVVPQKRKQAPGKAVAEPRGRQLAVGPAVDNNDDEEADEARIPKVEYTVVVLTLAELAKPVSRREPPATTMTLPVSMPWLDFQAQLNIKAVDIIFPDAAAVPANAYSFTYTVKRHATTPLVLSTAEEYAKLLASAVKNKSPEAKIFIKQLIPIAEANDGVDKENAPPQGQKKKKTRAPNKNDILPGNVAKNETIIRLRSHWQCNARGCHFEYCFVPADGGAHLPLSNELFDKWAAAMLHSHNGEPSATLEHPPSIREFDPVSRYTIVSKSPLLQARVKAMQQEKTPAVASGPVINVVLPENLLGLAGGALANSRAGDSGPSAKSLPSPSRHSGLIPSHLAAASAKRRAHPKALSGSKWKAELALVAP